MFIPGHCAMPSYRELLAVLVLAKRAKLRVKDYCQTVAWKHVTQQSAQLRLLVLKDLDTTSNLSCHIAMDRFGLDYEKIVAGKRHIQSIGFNINAFSTEECSKNFRFRPNELGLLSTLMNFTGHIIRQRYACNHVVAAYLVLK